ncbi:hypothetical protein L2E82_32001 [Cichorium intybus]|uniref:Uncharacterized protein n=1 Tax=Cichorium intybus TaxID=13427 RepID=A0ACB9BIX9_CICIN|nr:hypothetical protein L2E82_32001 [Cichorium intybus]
MQEIAMYFYLFVLLYYNILLSFLSINALCFHLFSDALYFENRSHWESLDDMLRSISEDQRVVLGETIMGG